MTLEQRIKFLLAEKDIQLIALQMQIEDLQKRLAELEAKASK